MRTGSIVKWNEIDINGDSFECLGMVSYIDEWYIAVTWADGDENRYLIASVKHKLELICE